MLIQENCRGFIIRKTHKKNGHFCYFSGMKDKKPVYMVDHAHAKAYSTREAAQKKIEQLKAF